MTPVRTESPAITVVCPTRTPATSVIAFSGPGRQHADDDAQVARARPLGRALRVQRGGGEEKEQQRCGAEHKGSAVKGEWG